MKKFPLKDCEQNIKDDCKCSVKFPECNRGIFREAPTPSPSPAPAPASPAPGPSPDPSPPSAKCPKELQNVVDETNVSISFHKLSCHEFGGDLRVKPKLENAVKVEVNLLPIFYVSSINLRVNELIID